MTIEMLAFIARGYHIFHPAIDAEIHQAVCAQTRAAFVEGKNPGNAIYERVPALEQVLSHPQMVGALTSILGRGLSHALPPPCPPDPTRPSSRRVSPRRNAEDLAGLEPSLALWTPAAQGAAGVLPPCSTQGVGTDHRGAWVSVLSAAPRSDGSLGMWNRGRGRGDGYLPLLVLASGRS